MVVNLAKKFHSANFGGSQPHNRPEISVSLKKGLFLTLGDVPPPFVFMDNDKIQKKNIFLLKACTCVL